MSKKNPKYTFNAMLARGWGRSVILRDGREVIAIHPPNQTKALRQQVKGVSND